LKGFGAWNVAIRLLPKRFDTTKTHSRLSFGWFLCLAHTESMSVKLTTTVSP
jgi:hypothetical protein